MKSNYLRRIGLSVSLSVVFLLASPSAGIAKSKPDGTPINWTKAREWWAFQPPNKAELPEISQAAWPSRRMDHFILAKLESKKLTPSSAAAKRTLARRLFLDLTGLPPTPKIIEAFLGDETNRAYEKLVENLIQQTAFGERLASMWLNISRYAEYQAHQVGTNTAFFYPNAYKYRRWIINAFNNDLSYDDFIRKQLAADLQEKKMIADLPALGFIGLGHKYYDRNRLAVKAEEWSEQVDTLTRAFLGLTVACAHCHDHKYDPVTQKDYYGLAGVFASTDLVDRMEDGSEIKKKSDDDKKRIGTIHIVRDRKPKDLHVFLRGNTQKKGDLVKRRFLKVLAQNESKPFTQGSGRLELADAIADANNPLTARVIVNRVWSLFFGRGLVATPSNFGQLGSPPSHSELLDDLAVRFMENNWSIKWLVRELVLSSTYQQSSKMVSQNELIDPENIYLWRMNRRRLSVEQWRDSILAASNSLDRRGGESLELTDVKNIHRTVYGRVSRKKLNDILMQFDYPDPNVHSAKRSVTTTAIQKLFMINSNFMVEQAKRLAKRITLGSTMMDSTNIQKTYAILYNREPTNEEINLALSFLQLPVEGKLTRWEQYSHALLAATEMMYID